MSSKDRVVLESLGSFGSLRTALSYLRSVSIVFEDDVDEGYSVISKEIKTIVGERGEEEAQILLECYLQAIISLHIALLYAGLTHYRKLGELNAKLKHSELEGMLEAAEGCGLLERMRQVRNSVFHVRPNKKVGTLINEVRNLAIDNGIGLARLEHLLYDFTSDVFSSTEIFQESEEVLMQGFNDALAYYDKHFAKHNSDIQM